MIRSARLTALLLLGALGCERAPELALAIRLPGDRHLLGGVTRLDLSATRDGRLLAQASFAGGARQLSLSGVTHGPRTVLALDGVTDSGDVVGRGRSCPFDFEKSGQVTLYFAPTNSFAPTAAAPLYDRSDPVALPLADGSVLFAGGATEAGTLVEGSELFLPASATFVATPLTLGIPRRRAEVVPLADGGALVLGGLDSAGHPVEIAEIFDGGLAQFVPLANMLLDARVGHRAVELSDGRVLVTGGASPLATALASTALVRLQAGSGTALVVPGAPLFTARREHAAVVTIGVPVVIGGYGLDGAPLASVEALAPTTTGQAFGPIASLAFARAEATATRLGDGSILVVGGAGDAQGTPRPDAELYNPVTRTTTVFPLAIARRRHTATLLSDGRVLVAGGLGVDGAPSTSVELFTLGVGFVSERPLHTPRAGHVALPLCDGTVLVSGGAADAELYTPPAV